MPSVIENTTIKEKCQIFTPNDIVVRMLDLADYAEDIIGKKILENSCGDGEILTLIVNRYIRACINKNFTINKIRKCLERDICAFEIDCDLRKKCIARLNKICGSYGIFNVEWNLKCMDFLSAQIDYNFDYIIGNPPYIAYPDLPKETRTFLKENFKTCKKGKFDYSYAFIEKSYNLLKSNGKLVYIIPSNIFKNVFARNLRELLKKDIISIIDFPQDKIFKNALVSPAIIQVIKDSDTVDFSYTKNIENEEQEKQLTKGVMREKWCFDETVTHDGIKLGDRFKVSSSIATLYNDAFVLKNGKMSDGFYCMDNFKIEVELIKKAASPKGKKYGNREEYIIFPYYFDRNDTLQHYTESEMYSKFPNAMCYLNSHKEVLLKRTSDVSAKWFEYGRSQAIQNMHHKKILISSIISDCTKAYLLEEDEIPYSGLYIIPNGEYSLEDLLTKINSEKFKKYIDNVGVCVSGTSKRITPGDIENFYY